MIFSKQAITPVASISRITLTFFKWYSSLCFASSSSSQCLVKASLTAAHCILMSSDISWRILSIKSRRLMEASFSRSALQMLSWLNVAHVSGVEALEEEVNGIQIGTLIFCSSCTYKDNLKLVLSLQKCCQPVWFCCCMQSRLTMKEEDKSLYKINELSFTFWPLRDIIYDTQSSKILPSLANTTKAKKYTYTFLCKCKQLSHQQISTLIHSSFTVCVYLKKKKKRNKISGYTLPCWAAEGTT